MIRKGAALVAAVAVGALGATVVERSSGPETVSSASSTAHSFVSALKHHNYGRACRWFTQEHVDESGGYKACRLEFVGAVGQAAMWGDPDPYATATVTAGGESEEGVLFLFGFTDTDDVYTATVVKTDKGWRIASVK
jgi:hypothetical protein